MGTFNVERFIALTFGLATAGAIGVAVWSASDDDEGTDEAGASAREATDTDGGLRDAAPPPAAQPDLGASPTAPPASGHPADEGEAGEGAQPPHPAVETPSWE